MAWENDQQEVMAAAFEEMAATVRASDTPGQCAPKLLTVFITAAGMLGPEMEAIFSLVALPFGGVDGLKAMAERGELP